MSTARTAVPQPPPSTLMAFTAPGFPDPAERRSVPPPVASRAATSAEGSPPRAYPARAAPARRAAPAGGAPRAARTAPIGRHPTAVSTPHCRWVEDGRPMAPPSVTEQTRVLMVSSRLTERRRLALGAVAA